MVREASGSAKTAGTAMPPTCPRRRGPTSGFRGMPEVTTSAQEAHRAGPACRPGCAGRLGELDGRGVPDLLASQVVREDRRPKTYQGYEGVVRLHLIPGLGKAAGQADRTGRPDLHHPDQAGMPVLQAWLGCSAGQRRAAARLASAVIPGCPPGWSSRSTPYSAMRWSPRCVRRSFRVTSPSWSRCPRPSTRSTGADCPPGQGDAGLPPSIGCRRCTSWRSSSVCGAGSCSGSAGRMSTWTRRSWKWSILFSGSAGRCVWFRRRPRTPRGRFRFPRCAWKRCGSISSARLPNERRRGRIGRITGWCSRRAVAPRWSRTTCAGAGARSARLLAWELHGFMISDIPA